MKNTRLTVFFALGMLVTELILPSAALAREEKNAGDSAVQSITQPAEKSVKKAEKPKRKRLLEKIFPSIGTRIWNPSISGHVRVNGDGHLALGVGYRVCAQKMKSGNDELEFKARGPFFQAIYKF